MTAPYDQGIEGLLADYRAQVEQAGETQRQLAEITGTATAVRQTVKATVGAQGELTALTFPTGAYKRMPPQELAGIILATVAEARAKAGEQVAELLGRHVPSGFDAAALLAGTTSVRDLLPVQPTMPDAVREYVDNGHRENRR